MDDLWGGVPEFPQFRELTLEDKPLFDQLFTRFPPVISEFTFTNLFIWRRAYRPQISRFRNFLCLLSEQGKNSFFFPPIGAGGVIECFQSLMQYLAGQGVLPKIARVPEAVVTQVDWKASGMKVELDRSQCDYLYLVQDMVELKGRKYHRKRNHIKQFKEKYSYEYIPLTPEWVPQCLQLQGAWCDLKNCDADPGLHNESLATKEAFSHFEEIGVKGGAILIDGKVEAFTLGDPLNPETIVIHVEKANPAYEGLYPTINQAFLEHEGAGYTYVNREQDLGEEGLRKAKESYFPHHMGNKYTISFE
ncbi:MAG TPA: phosphatidylglycerol lysyltransferase domain-containing protein [Thermodesulfobacteriota bacterium]|nr:phosphatidylglycerol lysyltransferase domain-containing protein [Thermodesulfobacteriota bacterium]